MSATDTVFAGSIPQLYDRCLGPLLFRPYAEELARRAKAVAPRRILETAAGTGIVTAALHDALNCAEIVATDLNPGMLEVTAQHNRSNKVTFKPADALDLPFDDESFDLVVCQFGVMFYPDRVGGHAEARRVLRTGGHYLLAVWDRLERNPASQAASEAVARMFPNDPPSFFRRIPHGYSDVTEIEKDLRDSGFGQIAIDTIEAYSKPVSARDAAIGICQGTPLRSEIEQRDPSRLEEATEAAAAAIAALDGPDRVTAPMSAHIVTAIK